MKRPTTKVIPLTALAMNPSRWLPSLLLAALACLPTPTAHAAPPGKTQQMTSPDQVPDGAGQVRLATHPRGV